MPVLQTAQVILDGLASDALLYNDGSPPSVVNLMICQFKVVLGAEAKSSVFGFLHWYRDTPRFVRGPPQVIF